MPQYANVLYSDWTQPDVDDCSLYAVMTWAGAASICRHIDYGTSSLCLLKTLSLTWPYCPCVNTPLWPSARLAGGPRGFQTAPPSTIRTGHVEVRLSRPSLVTPTISHPAGFLCDNSTFTLDFTDRNRFYAYHCQIFGLDYWACLMYELTRFRHCSVGVRILTRDSSLCKQCYLGSVQLIDRGCWCWKQWRI